MTDAAKLVTLAHYIARRRIRERLRDHGFRPQDFEASELAIASRAYLQAHLAELIAEARRLLSR